MAGPGIWENVYNPDLREIVTWVAMPIPFYHQCRTLENFLIAVKKKEAMLESSDRCVIVNVEGTGPMYAFWIQGARMF